MRLRSRLFYAYLMFLLVYAGFVMLPAPQKAILSQYHLSATGLRLIDVTIILLLAVIWFAGFYGYAKLRQYSRLIGKDRDGKHVAMLTRGILLMVLWLPVSSTVSAVLNFIAAHHLAFVPVAGF